MPKKMACYESGRAFFQFIGSPKYYEAREEALIKADYTCSRCSKRGDTYTMEVIGFSDYFEKKNGVEGLEVVCNSCCSEKIEWVDNLVTRDMNILMRYYFDEGLTVKECAKLLNTTKRYVKSILHILTFKVKERN